ncbi:MAG: FecR domain-containing protein [SAR324 cluster bacterium]|nr:FecR domain-containing protein [SAR324 cluster bacterium]
MFQKQLKTMGMLVFASLIYSVAIASQVGTLEIEEGTVVILREGKTQQMGEGEIVPVFAKDTLQTLGESTGIVILGSEDDGDLFTLDEKTTFVVQEYIISEDKEEATRGVVSLLGGKVRSLVNTAKGQKDIKMTAGTATIGVKGTDFLTEMPNSETTQVTTFEGAVSLQSRLGDVLQEVTIKGGFSSVALAGSAPSSPFELSRESLLESSRLVARPSRATQLEQVNARELSQENTTQGFNKAQFDRIVEDAARVKGSLIRVQIEFPDN